MKIKSNHISLRKYFPFYPIHNSSRITPIIKLNYKSSCISLPDKINKKIRRPNSVYQISCQLAPPFRTCWTSVPSPIALSRAQSFQRKLAAPSLQTNYPLNYTPTQARSNKIPIVKCSSRFLSREDDRKPYLRSSVVVTIRESKNPREETKYLRKYKAST